MSEALLEFEDVRAGYGESVVLDGVSFALPTNGSLAMLGRNGAGKTTLLLTAMGFVTMTRGAIRLNGADISKLAPHKRAQYGSRAGYRRNARFFPRSRSRKIWLVAARPGRWDLDSVFGLFPRLNERRANMGNHLSGGEQQMLTIGRTLMTNPAVLLLDEPWEGLAPIIVEELTAAVRRMTEEEGTALILVEQHAEAALRVTQDAVLLERGVIAQHMRSADLLKDEATLDRYLGLKIGG